MTTTCVCCERAMGDQAYACAGCTNRAGEQLSWIIRFTADARAVARGEVRRGSGGAGGKPGSRPPLDVGATDILNSVQSTLTTIAREIAEIRGLQIAAEAPRGRLVPDPLVTAARWLSGQLEWLRHAVDEQGGPLAASVYAEIAWCAGRMRGLVNGPSEQRFLGPCGALIIDPADPELICDCGHDGLDAMFHLKPCPIANSDWRHTCDGDIYGPRGGNTGTCRTCGATVATAEREAWLDGEVRAHAFRAIEIADAHHINVNTIRSWATRGLLKSYWRTDAGLVVPWTEAADGQARLHYVGDVLDLAAADAARRAEQQAKRARRQENAA